MSLRLSPQIHNDNYDKAIFGRFLYTKCFIIYCSTIDIMKEYGEGPFNHGVAVTYVRPPLLFIGICVSPRYAFENKGYSQELCAHQDDGALPY